MRIGIFQLLPAPERVSDGEVIAQALWEVDFAESNGFDAVWVTEHHLSSFGLIGAPSVYAAAAAQRTRRIPLHAAAIILLVHLRDRSAGTGSIFKGLDRSPDRLDSVWIAALHSASIEEITLDALPPTLATDVFAGLTPALTQALLGLADQPVTD